MELPLHAISERPGVYLMKDIHGQVLYVGKAKNLKVRLTTYFARGGDERAQIPYLLSQVADVETIVVPSEKEALLLEARLIQQFKPKYNVLLKDDKSHLRIHLNLHHPYPRIELIRVKPGAKAPKDSFGPFTSARSAYEFFDLVVRLFRLRQCRDEEFRRRTSPCLLYQLKKCTAPCVGSISKEAYQDEVQKALKVLGGHIKGLQKQIKEEMQKASDSLDFERASVLLRLLRVLESSEEERKTSRVKGVKNVDVIALFQEEKISSLCVMQYREGSLVYSQTLLFESDRSPVELDQLILQWYQLFQHHPIPPSEVLLEKPVSRGFKEALEEDFKRPIRIVIPQKGPKRDLLHLAEENAYAHYLQKSSSDDRLQSLLLDVQDTLHLSKLPIYIDCFDVSHLGGRNPVASCVSFKEGKPFKRGYRTIGIKKEISFDDCRMLQEAIERRYRHATEMPDLVLIDGGFLQLKASRKALQKVGCIDTNVRAITKEEARHDRGLTAEKILGEEIIQLERTSPVLHFVQRIRDEAHRFAMEFQKKRRSRSFISSELDDIAGIGPKKKQKLLKAFSGVDQIRKASVDEIQSKADLSEKDARLVFDFFTAHP